MQTPDTKAGRRRCYGCPTLIADTPGNYYCEACVAEQQREQAEELRAFDAFHRFADRVARGA